MWYYIKDNKQKEGPISDPALAMLFKKGEVKPTTMVWSQNMKKWTELKNTNYYAQLVGNRKNYALENFKFRTYLFRALSVSLALLLVFKINLIHNIINLSEELVENSMFEYEINTFFQYKVCLLNSNVVTTIQFFLSIALFCSLAYWVAGAVTMTKKRTSALRMSKTLSAVGILVPIANIILIPSILKRIYRTLEFVVRKRLHIASHIFLKTWMYLWFLSWINYSIDIWNKMSIYTKDIIYSMYYFKIYICAVQIVTIIATVILITIITNRVKHIQERNH